MFVITFFDSPWHRVSTITFADTNFNGSYSRETLFSTPDIYCMGRARPEKAKVVCAL